MLKKRASVFREKYYPPAIGLLDQAGIFANNENVYLKQRFNDKGFIKEVHDIADQTLNTYPYCDDGDNNKSYSGFNVTLGGSLDIINPSVGCRSLKCKRNEALNIARTAGLFANKLFITDHLSSYLSSYNKTPIDYKEIQLMTSVLSVLAPLIDAKVIELRTPRNFICQDCMKIVDTQVQLFLESVLDYEAELNVTYLGPRKHRHLILINSPEFERFLGLLLMLTN